MGQRAKGYATAGGLLDFANGTSGLKGSMFGINNRSASKGFVGTANTDARTYMALGNYYADSVENPHKTINYRKVDQEVASRVLRGSGKGQSFRTKTVLFHLLHLKHWMMQMKSAVLQCKQVI